MVCFLYENLGQFLGMLINNEQIAYYIQYTYDIYMIISNNEIYMSTVMNDISYICQ